MILTIQDNYNKHQGTNLPMFSRSGKSTINQYLVFNQDKKRSVDVNAFRRDNNDDFDMEPDDLEMMMGDKPNNIDQEM